MKTRFLLLATIVGTAFFFQPLQSQTAPIPIADSLQSILDASLPTNFANAGAVMGIVVPGQWSWYGATGSAIAGITIGQPQTQATPLNSFRAGSITKMMVATCILKLEQDSLLSIEDPIALYLRTTLHDDTIAASDTIRIRHLLNHTSGVANSGDNTTCQMDVLTNPLGAHTLEEAIYCGASLGELFPPGFAWGYSNTNYSILAMIIQQITGQTCASYITQHIITPLNLQNTEIPTTNQITTPHMGCYWNINGWVDLTIINPSTYTGWADVVSTTEDLMIFYAALQSGSIINATELAKMRTLDQAALGYGLGLDFYTIQSIDYIGHYGEVGNTSGLFFANVQSSIAPNGYYISYNFNTQGVAMQSEIDVPVFLLMNSNFSGVSEFVSSRKLKLFPNPASENCTIHYTSSVSVQQLDILSLLGETISSITLTPGSSSVEISLENFAAGTYFVNLIGEEQLVTSKLIVR